MTKKYNRIAAIDYESFLISNETPIPQPVCLSWAEGDKSGLLNHIQAEKYIEDLYDTDTLIIAQNVTFELLLTYHYYPNLREKTIEHLDKGLFYCTQLYQTLLDNVAAKPSNASSLADLVKLYFNKDISETKTDPDAWRLRYSELYNVPLSQWPKPAVDYAINDSIYALRIYKEQQIENDTIRFDSHVRASFALNYMAAPGMLIDSQRVEVLTREIDEYLNPIYDQLEAKGFMKRDKNGKLSKNIKVLQEYVKENFTGHKLTDKKAIQVSGEALDFYSLEKEDDIITMFRSIGVYEKAKSAFLSNLKKADPVIRTSYNAIVRSGRTSARRSSAYPSVNIQQMPRTLKGVTYDIRNCFVARAGYKFVSIDYNNLELLSTAQQLYNIYGTSAMKDIINSGEGPTDLHAVFACELMTRDLGKEVTYDEFVKNKKDPKYKPYREKGKPVTLGVPGGLGMDTMRTQFNAAGIKLAFKEIKKFGSRYAAQSMVWKYQSEFPNIRVARTGFREYTVVVDELVGLRKILYKLYPELERFLRTGHEKYLNGHTKWEKDDWGEWEKVDLYRYQTNGVKRNYCTYTALCNGLMMQGTSAVGAKLAVWNAFKDSLDKDDVWPRAFIHDEILWEIKDDDKFQENVDRCAEIMIDSMAEILPDVRISVEAEYFKHWTKSANEGSRQYWKDKGCKVLQWEGNTIRGNNEKKQQNQT